jgi:hypothetical protein
MDPCEYCKQLKPSVRPRGYTQDMTGYQIPPGQRQKFPMSVDLCDQCFEQAQIRGTKAYEWFSEKKQPPSTGPENRTLPLST